MLWTILVVLAINSSTAQADTTLPLSNPDAGSSGHVSGEEGCGGLDPALNYWHFVVVPNSGAGTFLSITLVLDNGGGETQFVFTGDDIIPNGDQTDNVFVEVPAGYEVTDIVSGSATISGTANKFNLSHTCEAGFTPLTAEKTADGLYDTNFHWTLEKTVDPTSHSGTAGEVAGDSDWTITATKVDDPITDIKVVGSITINNDNDVAVPVTVTDVLDDGTVATVDCGGATQVEANDSLVCSYEALPTGITASLNTATIASGNPDIAGTEATAPVEFNVEEAHGDDPVVLTDPHLGLTEETSSTIVRVINEEFPCSSVATDYIDGAYSYTVPNDAFLDGGETHLTASAEVVVDCTLPALRAEKTAEGTFSRDLSWTLNKLVDGVKEESFSGLPGSVFDPEWQVDVDLVVGDPEGFGVSGTITVYNDALIPQDFTVSDVLDDGTVADVVCDASTVPAGGSVECSYVAAPADGSATLNTATVSAAGNADVPAYADVEFEFSGFTGDTTVDLTDARRPLIDRLGLLAAIRATDVERFVCAASDSPLYVNGTYTETFTNTALLTGETTLLDSSASVTITCNQRRVEGGHTIGYWFNAPAGVAQTVAARTTLLNTYPNVLAGVNISTVQKAKQFGNNANCSGTCTTMLQAQFIATAMSVLTDTTAPYYGDQCVAVPTYIDADGVAQIDDLLTAINAGFPWSLARTIELKTLLDNINNDLPFNLC